MEVIRSNKFQEGEKMFEKLIETINNYDLLNLLIINSACQLMPENANKVTRLEAMAYCICSNKYQKNKPNLSKSRLKSIYNTNMYGLEKISVLEDPFEQMFTESIPFYGGAYIVFPGITESGTLIIKHILKSIFLYRSSPKYSEFFHKAYQISLLLLTISDVMAKRAGLGYGEVSRVTNKNIQLPSRENEEILFNAVTFDIDEIKKLIDEKGIDSDIFESFVIELGDVNINEYSSNNHKLHLYPFVRIENKIIVAMPCNLIAVLRHALINLAIEYDFINELRNNFEIALWNTVVKSLDIMDIKPIEFSLPSWDNDLPFKEGVFSIDLDKVMYVQLHTDDFSDYDKSIVFDNGYQIDNEILEQRALESKQFILENNPEIREVLILVLLQTVGRSLYLGLEHLVDENCLIMSVNDLEIIALLEGDDPLHLYKYAKAYKKLKSTTKCVSASFLDSYSIYRSNDKSFYMSDDKQPDFICFSAGGGRDVIEEMHRKIAPHGIPMPNGNGITEVVSLYGDKTIPIFTSLSMIGKTVALAVEGKQWIVWVSSPHLHPVVAKFIDMVAYWLWQFSEELDRLLIKGTVLHLEINLYPLQYWIGRDYPMHDEETKIDYISYSVSENNIFINVHYNFSELLKGPTNFGERELIKKILMAIQELSGVSFTKQIDELLDEYAPLGPKKKLLVFDQDNYSVLCEPGSFPKLRFIDSADENEILDNIGFWLRNEKAVDYGQILNRTEILNDVVGYLYSEIKEIISTLKDPQGVLETFMLYYEALLYMREENRTTLTTTLYCFSNNNKQYMIDKINKNTNRINKLSLSLRFLIEYVSACPPQEGKKSLTLEIFDRLLALSSELIRWANNSDLVRYQLADLHLTMLPSGRLGIGNDKMYISAGAKYLREHGSETLNYAIRTFESNWRVKRANNDISGVDQELIQAFEDEFGIGLFEFSNIISSLIDIGRRITSEIKRLPLNKLIDNLKELTGLSEITINKAIEILSLKPREDYLSPPEGFKKEDIYPWKFNRELSYIRRPLILFNDIVFWSNRHLYYCGGHILDLCLDGKLKAKSTKMKKLISKYLNIKGEKFNESIYNLFVKYDFLIVKSKVKKVGGYRIMDEKGELGDIDVLIINPKNKKVYTIECKDLSIARNPYEIHHELNKIFFGFQGKPSIVEKHQKRTEWIRNNISKVLESFNLLHIKGKWEVKPIIVINEEMISPYLYSSKGIKVISYNKLIEELESGKFFK